MESSSARVSMGRRTSEKGSDCQRKPCCELLLVALSSNDNDPENDGSPAQFRLLTSNGAN
jgi:hypothetical protein